MEYVHVALDVLQVVIQVCQVSLWPSWTACQRGSQACTVPGQLLCSKVKYTIGVVASAINLVERNNEIQDDVKLL
jgi:hypothetical protein